MTKEQIITQLKELKPKYEQKGFIILGLFGSYAKNEAIESSDIDVAIKLKDDFLQTHDVWTYFDGINSIKSDISKKFGVQCDVLDFDSSSPLVEKIKNEVVYV